MYCQIIQEDHRLQIFTDLTDSLSFSLDLNRKHGEKISELQDSLQDLRSENLELKSQLSEREQSVKRLQDQLSDAHKQQVAN